MPTRSVLTKTICGGCCCVLFLYWISVAGAGSAISVPKDARASIETALAVLEERKAKEQQKKDLAEAEEYVKTSEAEALRAEAEAEEARKAAEKAEREADEAERAKLSTAQEAKEAADYASRLMEATTKAQLEANAAERSATAKEAATTRRDRAAMAEEDEAEALRFPVPAYEGDRRPGLGDTDELRVAEGEQWTQERSQRELDAARKTDPPTPKKKRSAPPADWGAVNRAYRRAADLQKIADEANKRAEDALRAVDEKVAAAEAAAARAEDATLILADARGALADYEAYARDARADADQMLVDRDNLVRSINSPPTARNAGAAVEYYHWDDGRMRSGYQTAIPIEFGSWRPEFSYGVYTQYIMSDNLDTLTDTTLYLGASTIREKYWWDYSLAINVPTGKSALDWGERYARVTEDLTRVEQFGKGWQFTPGVAYSWRTNGTDVWTIGTTYTYGLEYDPTSDIPNDDLTPGDEWGKFLRYQHVEEKWQFVGELLNTSYGRTKIKNGSSYRDSDSWEGRLTYNRVLNEEQNLMFYYWLARQSQTDVPFATDDPLVHYFGTMWTKQLNDRGKLRVTADVMTTNGSRYFGLYSYRDMAGNPQYGAEMVDGRTKYTFGIGYDRAISADNRLYLGVEYFQMHDGKSTIGYPATTYDGVNAYLSFFKTF